MQATDARSALVCNLYYSINTKHINIHRSVEKVLMKPTKVELLEASIKHYKKSQKNSILIWQ